MKYTKDIRTNVWKVEDILTKCNYKFSVDTIGPTYEIYVDASDYAVGISDGTRRKSRNVTVPLAGELWDRVTRDRIYDKEAHKYSISILLKEMYALAIAAKFAPTNSCVRFWSDSQASIAVLAKSTCRNYRVNLLCDYFWRTCRDKRITPVVQYVRSEYNPAD